MFEESEIDDRIAFIDADEFAEIADSFGWEAAAAHAGDGRHTRIIPTGDDAVFHEAQESSFAHDGIGQV